MKRLLALLLALVLFVSGFSSFPVHAQENLDLAEVSKENLDLSFQKHPSMVGEERNELSGFLSLKDLEETLEPGTKVRVVIELHSDPVIVEATKKGVKVDEMSEAEVYTIQASLLSEQASAKQELSSKGIETSTTNGEDPVAADDSYTVAVNAFTTYVNVEDITEVEKLSSVKNVYVANEYFRPEVVVNQNAASEMVNANIAWEQYALKGEGTVVAVIDSGIDPAHSDFVLSDPSTAALTREHVSSLGLPGKYYSEKVPYAYNYYDLSQKVIDLSEDGHHGQHVAGSVAANGTVKGVAPEAQVLGMKVFSDDFDYSTTFSDVYLKAIDDAIALGADVLNMSLGSPAGFYVEGSIEDIALKNAQENGIVSTISAGNETHSMNGAETWGQYLASGIPNAYAKNPDIGVVGSPSVNEASLSVASIDNLYQSVQAVDYTIDGVTHTASMSQATGSPDPHKLLSGPQPVVRVGIGTAQDFAAVGDAVEGKIALVMRGNAFTDSLANAEAAGASGLIVFNHATGGEALVSMAGGNLASIPYVFIGHAAGMALHQAFEDGKNPTVTFTGNQATVENPTGGFMSSFSSWGATPDLRMKPEITAPGGMIYSLQNNNSYGVMSGTSMAAPNAAGGAAVVQQHLKTNPEFLALNLSASQRALLAKTLLMNTATLVTDDYNYPYLVRQQGAGLMNVANAIETKVFVTETGERVIIVTGCINVLESRVSGTSINNNSCIY